MSRPTRYHFEEEKLERARRLWKLANEFSQSLPHWGDTKIGDAHLIAGAALYSLAQAISESAGCSVLQKRQRNCSYENALRENLLGFARSYGPQEAAELAYRLADGVATGIADRTKQPPRVEEEW